MVEQLTLNQLVGGSIPPWRTYNKPRCETGFIIFKSILLKLCQIVNLSPIPPPNVIGAPLPNIMSVLNSIGIDSESLNFMI